MAIIRGMGSNSLTNQSTCGGNIKGGLAPVVNNSANVNRIIGGPTSNGTRGLSPATLSKKDIPATCVSGDKFHPKYCCPIGVGQMYQRIGMGKYNI